MAAAKKDVVVVEMSLADEVPHCQSGGKVEKRKQNSVTVTVRLTSDRHFYWDCPTDTVLLSVLTDSEDQWGQIGVKNEWALAALVQSLHNCRLYSSPRSNRCIKSERARLWTRDADCSSSQVSITLRVTAVWTTEFQLTMAFWKFSLQKRDTWTSWLGAVFDGLDRK